MTWYPIVNDLVGGWAVANNDIPMSQIDFRARETIVIADMMNFEDADLIAQLLNDAGVERNGFTNQG